MENTGSHGPDPTLYHHHPLIHFISRNTDARHLVDSGTSYCALGCHVSRCLWLVALPTHLSHLMIELLTILCLVFDLITEFLAKFISGQLLPAVFLYWLLVKNKVFFVLLFPTLSGHAVWKMCVLLRWGNIKKSRPSPCALDLSERKVVMKPTLIKRVFQKWFTMTPTFIFLHEIVQHGVMLTKCRLFRTVWTFMVAWN